MKKLILIFFNLLFIWYLITPPPVLKDIPNTVRSNLPGDTVQLKNVSAYFGNVTRTEVINFYKANYNGLFRIQLNHPPEKAQVIIRDTTQSYYLEEFVLPFKESIFINGYEWQNDVFTKPENRFANKMIYDGIEYQAKITIKKFPTTVAQRLISFFITEISVILIFLIYKQILTKKYD
jgi:hypothetical protein